MLQPIISRLFMGFLIRRGRFFLNCAKWRSEEFGKQLGSLFLQRPTIWVTLQLRNEMDKREAFIGIDF